MKDETLTAAEQATNYQTMRHIERVRNLLGLCVVELLRRGELHDQSKLAPPEVALFTEMTDKLAKSTYGSPEYEAFRKQLGPALDHHYANNRHHPEHYKNGVDDMSLFDVLEMLMDWKASSERHNNGNIRKSIEINGNRFGLSPQLIRMMDNTVDYLGW